jgi:hypothetical protein
MNEKGMQNHLVDPENHHSRFLGAAKVLCLMLVLTPLHPAAKAGCLQATAALFW